jgi:signal peptidase I
LGIFVIEKRSSLEKLEHTAAAAAGDEALTEAVEETPDQPDSVGDRTGRRLRHLVREFVETIVLTLVIFAIINVLTGRFRVEGPSMEPSLHQGQYLIINKIVYKLHPPRRGDIIVFHHPSSTGRDLIKRVIGLPGEMVEIREGKVYIDGVLIEEPYVAYQSGYSVRYVLGPDEFFVLGDNRPNSDDSHNWGVLKREFIVGKAWLSYWPPEEWGGVPHHGYPESSTTHQELGTVIGFTLGSGLTALSE